MKKALLIGFAATTLFIAGCHAHVNSYHAHSHSYIEEFEVASTHEHNIRCHHGRYAHDKRRK
jgi:protein involved in sex pheromone biosynthesis